MHLAPLPFNLNLTGTGCCAVRNQFQCGRADGAARRPYPLSVPGIGSAALKWVAVFFTTGLSLAQIPQPTDAPRPQPPEQSAAAFKLPDGFRMEVVASEPLIASPSG